MEVLVRQVSWGDPTLERLCADQQAELAHRYGEPDLEANLPGADMVVCLVAEVAGQAVACGALRRLDATHGELKRMYTVPRWRRRGLAQLVLAELERRAVDLEFISVVLETGIRQPEAIAMYEARGYRSIAPYGYYAEHAESRCYAKQIGIQVLVSQTPAETQNRASAW